MPDSLHTEPIHVGVLMPSAKLRSPPAMVPAAAILPETLPVAWQGDGTTGLAIATALSQQQGFTLPWKTVRDVIGGALHARFVALTDDTAPWPCELPAAQTIKLSVSQAEGGGGGGGGEGGGDGRRANVLTARASFEVAEIQNLADEAPSLLNVRAKSGVPMPFSIQFNLGDGSKPVDPSVVAEVNEIVSRTKDGFALS